MRIAALIATFTMVFLLSAMASPGPAGTAQGARTTAFSSHKSLSSPTCAGCPYLDSHGRCPYLERYGIEGRGPSACPFLREHGVTDKSSLWCPYLKNLARPAKKIPLRFGRIV